MQPLAVLVESQTLFCKHWRKLWQFFQVNVCAGASRTSATRNLVPFAAIVTTVDEQQARYLAQTFCTRK